MAVTAAVVGTNPQTHVSTLSVSVSATGGPGRIVLVICSEVGEDVFSGAVAANVTGISGLGATWQQRAALTNDDDSDFYGERIEEWYADFTVSVSGTVTISLDHIVGCGYTTAIFFSSSVGAVLQFDPNGSLPATSFVFEVLPVSTDSHAPYVLIMSVGTAEGGAQPGSSPTPVTTYLVNATQSDGTNTMSTQIVGGTYTKLTSTNTGFVTAANFFTLIDDAVIDSLPAQGNMLLVMGT